MIRLALLGYPVGHSFSPQIHHAALAEHKIAGNYEKISIEPEQFHKKVQQLIRGGKYQGFNITIPHKIKIIQHLEHIDPIAKLIGAVNTVQLNENGWTGYNTDYAGFLQPLHQFKDEIQRALMIGAGGAARAVALGLTKLANIEHINIVNRTPGKAKEIADLINQVSNIEVDVHDITQIPKDNEFDLILNTTSVGMNTDRQNTPLNPLNHAHKKTIVYDLIYNPLRTKFLALAAEEGLRIINGLPMLIGQAEESFFLWTGKRFSAQLKQSLYAEFSAKKE